MTAVDAEIRQRGHRRAIECASVARQHIITST
jgi:hypothetical protein